MAVRAHLYGRTVKRPKSAISVEPEIFHTFVKIDRGRLWGYRIDYSITQLAVVVLAGKALYR
jgi:hypothetical protein